MRLAIRACAGPQSAPAARNQAGGQGAAPAPMGPPDAAVQLLRQNARDPAVRQQFQQKYGVDPGQYLTQ